MKYTKEVFKSLSSGQFLSANSIDPVNKAAYSDVEKNFEEYRDYFEEIDFQLEAGNNYYYFSRKENKVVTEQKLKNFFNWIDYLDLLKTYDNNFGSGTQFNLAVIEARLQMDVELKEKLQALLPEKATNREKLEEIAKQLVMQGFAETTNEMEGIYQVTDAFHYLEEIVMTINISEEVENEISE